MHRRNSTNRHRLDRRKSTTSVKSVHLEHIQPETAERDARMAATQAFARAKARSSTDSTITLWPATRFSAGLDNSSTASSGCMEARSDETRSHQQQSIRFVQPRPLQLAPNSTMAQNTSFIPRNPNHTVAHSEADPHPSSGASASGMVSAIKGAAGDYIDTLFTSEEYYTPEDDVASMPSSYRKLRKSRSMFTNASTATVPRHPVANKPSTSTSQLPLPANTYFRLPDRDETIPSRGLKAPKSMSFLRDFRGNFGSTSKYENSNTAPPSTSRYPGGADNAMGSLRPKPSRFFRSRGPSQERVFRKSMRETSDGAVSMDTGAINNGSLRYKARKVSQGLKHKLKNLFGLGQDDRDNAGLPLQHINAQQSHVFSLEDSQHGANDELCVSSNDQAALLRVASGIPSLHAVPSHQQLRSRKGSIESLQSEQKASDDRSRVTSWSNSETNTVITHNSCLEDRERKRLSIINENGAHVCSSSAQFLTISEQSNASSTSLHRPVQTAPVPVDCQRIYSALMKRMDQSQQAHTSGPERQSNVDDSARLERVLQNKSSLRPRCLSREPNTTIRYVMPESESDSEPVKGGERLHVKDKHGLLSTKRADQEKHDNLTSAHMNTNAGDALPEYVNNKVLPTPTSEEAPTLLHTLSSRSSAFFGSPTRHLFRTQSPYRRAIQDRMHTTLNEQPLGSSEFNPWMRSLSNLPNVSIRPLSTHGSDADIRLQYTESIYSTNTEDGQPKRQSFLSVVEDISRPRSTHGDATIFLNQPGTNRRSSSLPPQKRVSSSASSVEWKMWLSSNVSKLEETSTQVDHNNFEYHLSTAAYSGHVRENAQINDEEGDRIPGALDTPARTRDNRDSFFDFDQDIEDDDQPRPFDAGETHTEFRHSRRPFDNPLPTGTSKPGMTSPVASPVTYPKGTPPNGLRRMFGGNREKELPKVPSLSFKGSSASGHTNMTTKFAKYKPTPKNSMTPLTNRSLSSAAEDQAEKTKSLPASRRKLYGVTPTKSENVSPGAMSDDDPYGIKGAGVLGPDQEDVGSKRMVDIFLSSRRRRMISDDEGSVFL